jgi:ubiquinone/menaquinone biosynthesis C-methylase UbiE
MTDPSKVETYFSGVATGYQDASDGKVWGIVRRREAKAVMHMIGDVRGRDVLELGCGAGFYTRLLLSSGVRHVWAVDLSQPMLDQLPKGHVTPLLGDAESFDPGRAFDRLLSAGMLEFVADPAAALRNAARFAAPGARFALLLPTDGLPGKAYRYFHKRHGLAISLFSRDRLASLGTESGWQLADYSAAGPYSAAAVLTRVAH